MSFLPSFLSWQFAAAGVACAAGPIIIHLLNRRRFRTVQWAAMEFLLQAARKNRRILHLRDLILLLLRTLAVLLFAFALAQPYFAANTQSFDGQTPLHAILVVDNSLSMGYQSLDGPLIDQAKQRAREFVDRLPEGSMVSVIPLCGTQRGFSPDAYPKKEDAIEALNRIEVVDRTASMQRALNEAKTAADSGPKLAKRILVFSDQQRRNWADLDDSVGVADLDSVQFVSVAPNQWENAWISDFRIQDGLADVETPTLFQVRLNYRGQKTHHDVQVTLSVSGEVVAAQQVTLRSSDGGRELSFQHTFNNLRPEPGKPVLVPCKVSISSDRLPDDDQREMVVHVVAALPVVFVDQFRDEEEDPVTLRFGETKHFRSLLAPVTNRDNPRRQLIRVDHISLAQLTRERLGPARLVVIAGIRDPGDKVQLLREYLLQGGQLVIAAGGQFQSSLWQTTAWREGQGILPLPLKDVPIGALPSQESSDVKPRQISFESLGTHDYFYLQEESEADRRRLFAEPYFFKAVAVDEATSSFDVVRKSESSRIRKIETLRQEIESLKNQLAGKQATKATDSADLDARQKELRTLQPQWLLWQHPDGQGAKTLTGEQLERELVRRVESQVPRVLARLESVTGPPLLVERRFGKGSCLFVGTGILSAWNTLPYTNTLAVFDRILRSKIRSTLPRHNYEPRERIAVGLPVVEPDILVQLQRPKPATGLEYLDAGFMGQDQRAAVIEKPYRRGVYHLSVAKPAQEGKEEILWQAPLAVNGNPEESDLVTLTSEEFNRRNDKEHFVWVGPGDTISLAGAQIRGQNSWWYLIVIVIGILLLETGILLGPARKRAAST